MTDILVHKTQTGWAPFDEAAIEAHARHKLGETVKADFKRIRNVGMHKKFFALLNLAFDYWETGDGAYKGEPVAKNFERFRKDAIILAGYYEPVYNMRGEVRLEAKSISFANMSQDEFDDLYNKVMNVLLDRVMRAKGFSKESIDDVVDQLMSFN